ncbi:MAG: dihydrodipicolinate synthase family protein [Chloroflexi bacterium]|nr:dihydrodipicolinate synthase family protein [Chloroflexota bacterium]
MQTKIADLKKKLKGGVAPAMVTPLLADGYTVNTAVIPPLVDFLITAGAKGLFVGGTTGEGILLTVEERLRLHEAAVLAANSHIPVIIHSGANRLDTAVTLSHHAADIGADAIAAVTPYFYGLNDDGLATYYEAIAAAVPTIPLLLYDIPQLAVNGISPELVAHLAQTLPSLAGFKTSCPKAQIVRKLIDAAPEHGIVLVGNEAIALGTLAMGADGMISGLSTAVPEPFVRLTAAVAQGNLKEARRRQFCINRMSACLPAGVRIGAIKQILWERGLAVGSAVPPRPAYTQPLWAQIERILHET